MAEKRIRKKGRISFEEIIFAARPGVYLH